MPRREISLHNAAGRLWLNDITWQSHVKHRLLAVGLLDPVHEMVLDEQRRDIREAVARLPDRQRQAITKLYGLDGAGRRTLAEVGKEMGNITPQRVAQLRNGGLERLRSNSKLATLL